jgi:hypothetical protein
MELSLFNVFAAFFVQILLTVGAVILSVRIGLSRLEVKLDDAILDVLRVEKKVDQINGNVRGHDREIAGIQKELEIISRSP